MDNRFKSIQPGQITDNTFKLIGSDWMLITAGKLQKYNMMTASWGGFGILWGKSVCFCFIRPQRYTYEFVEKHDIFTLSFFDEGYRQALNLCGQKSGRDIDKTAATGLTPAEDSDGAVYFGEARLVIKCRKIYFQDLDPGNFIDPEIERLYPTKEYHRMYIGEIIGSYYKAST